MLHVVLSAQKIAMHYRILAIVAGVVAAIVELELVVVVVVIAVLGLVVLATENN
jgi:hypothetical protein